MSTRRRRRSGDGGGRPFITLPGVQSVLFSALPLVLSSGNGNQITVSDPNFSSLDIVITSPIGTVTLSGTTGLTGDTDGSDGSLSFSGTIANINNAFDGIEFYSPTYDIFTFSITATNAAGKTRTQIVTVDVLGTPVFNVAPAIDGIPVNGTTFICSDGSIGGTPPMVVTKEWRINGVAIPDLGDVDEWASSGLLLGDLLTVAVTADNDIGDPVTVVTTPVTIEQAPINTVAPVVDGVPQNGEILSVTSDGTWTGTATITFTYQWTINGVDVVGATADEWEATGVVPGDLVLCAVTGVNSRGSSMQASNAITIANLSIIAPSSIEILEGAQPYTFSLDFEDLDEEIGDTYQVELELPSGTMTLGSGFGSLGLTFTVGDGTADPALSFSDALADLISATTNMSFTGLTTGETPLEVSFEEEGTADSISIIIPIIVSDLPANTFFDGSTARYLTDGPTTYLTDGA